MKKTILLQIFLLINAHFLFAEMPIRFFKENIRIELSINRMIVKGTYFFVNQSDFDIDVDMTYLFYVDSLHPYPERIEAAVGKLGLPFRKNEKNIVWSLHFKPESVDTVSVTYTQELKSKDAIYIMNTAQLWNQKLDRASFVIITPKNFPKISFSIEPDSFITKRNEKIYYITKRYYTPKKNFIMTW